MSAERLVDGEQRRVHLGPELGQGAEGAVHRIERPKARLGQVAKVVPEAARAQRAAQLKALVGMRSGLPAELLACCTWPQELLFDGQGRVAGYLMEELQGTEPLGAWLNPTSRRERRLALSLTDRLALGVAVAMTMRTLHRSNVLVGDVSESNVRVAHAGGAFRALLIDTDSFLTAFHPEGARGAMATPGYLQPERCMPARFVGPSSREDDQFGLAVLLFKLLFDGGHPFAAVGGAPRDQEEVQRSALLPWTPDGRRAGLDSPKETLPTDWAGLTLRAAFEAGLGLDRARRPTAHDWVELLERTRTTLVPCPADPNHLGPSASGPCRLCAAMARDGMDRSHPDGHGLTARRDGLRLRAMEHLVRGVVALSGALDSLDGVESAIKASPGVTRLRQDRSRQEALLAQRLEALPPFRGPIQLPGERERIAAEARASHLAEELRTARGALAPLGVSLDLAEAQLRAGRLELLDLRQAVPDLRRSLQEREQGSAQLHKERDDLRRQVEALGAQHDALQFKVSGARWSQLLLGAVVGVLLGLGLAFGAKG